MSDIVKALHHPQVQSGHTDRFSISIMFACKTRKKLCFSQFLKYHCVKPKRFQAPHIYKLKKTIICADKKFI